MMFDRVGCSFPWAVVFASLLPVNAEPEAKNTTLKQLLLSKEVGHNLYHSYRSTLIKQGWSLLPKDVALTPSCFKDIVALRNDKMKMIKYLDAAGKPKSGIFRGNFYWFGSFGECEDISDAHYCLSTLGLSLPASKFKLPSSITWGACFPKSCNSTDISFLLGFIFPMVEKSTHVDIQYKGTLCPEKAPYTSGVKVTLVICGFLLFLCLTGTILDLAVEVYSGSATPAKAHHNTVNQHNNFTPATSSILTIESHGGETTSGLNSDDVVLLLPKQPSLCHRVSSTMKAFFYDFFLCFSVVRNTGKIFNTNVPPTAITSINGIRVISMTWVILGHTFLGFIESPFMENKAQILEDAKLFTIMPVISGPYSVDSFFYLSGLLVAYTCFRKMKNSGGKFNWVLFYTHRFWRLTPPYMFVILFSVELKRFLSNGPLWYSQYNDPLCSKYWWTNLLYINNFYPKDFGKECIVWTWYLANDMQFFVITPMLLIPLFWAGWHGLVLPLGLLLESSVLIAFIYGHYDLDPIGSMKIYHFTSPTPEITKKMNEYQNYVYGKPYCRIQPYLVGFLLGYYMYRNFNRTVRRPGWVVTLVGWAVAAVVAMLLVYGPHKSILPGAEPWNKAENILFGTFQRLLWGLVLAWVTYACHYGCGGLVQRFLSARFWIPLSRLTYSVYLIHLIVLSLMLVGAQGAVHYDLYTVSYYFIACVVLSYGSGFILAVAIEFPCDNLENVAMKYLKKLSCRKR